MPTPIDLIRQFYKPDSEMEARIMDLMETRTYKRGDMITGTGTLDFSSFYIVSGSARVFYLMNGKEKTFSFSFEDEFIAVSRHLIDSGDNTLSIQFLEPTTVIALKHAEMKRIIDMKKHHKNMTEILLFVNMALFKMTQYLEERLVQFQQASARDRYEWAIKRYPRLLEVANGTQLASFLGLTRETLYRIRSGDYNS